MQIAALNTPYLNESEVPAEIIEHEKEVMRQQVINEGKPEQIADKIVMGRLVSSTRRTAFLTRSSLRTIRSTLSSTHRILLGAWRFYRNQEIRSL